MTFVFRQWSTKKTLRTCGSIVALKLCQTDSCPTNPLRPFSSYSCTNTPSAPSKSCLGLVQYSLCYSSATVSNGFNQFCTRPSQPAQPFPTNVECNVHETNVTTRFGRVAIRERRHGSKLGITRKLLFDQKLFHGALTECPVLLSNRPPSPLASLVNNSAPSHHFQPQVLRAACVPLA